MIHPTLKIERKLWREKIQFVAGVDEAGRGALAGPVVAAAVVFAPGRKPRALGGVRDSKTLSAKQREALAGCIKEHAIAWTIGVISHRVIDRINIANASLNAMRRAVLALDQRPVYVLCDGFFAAHTLQRTFGGIPARAIVKGDAMVFSIAAASIIAKVERDSIMRRLHAKHPQYGFARHKGYGTRAHYEALAARGPCAAHRKTFRLV